MKQGFILLKKFDVQVLKIAHFGLQNIKETG